MQEINFTSSKTFLYDVVIDSRRRFRYRDAVLHLLGIVRIPAWPRLQVSSQNMLYRRTWLSETPELTLESTIVETDPYWDKYALGNKSVFPESITQNTEGEQLYPDIVNHSSNSECLIEQTISEKPESVFIRKNSVSSSILDDQRHESLIGGNKESEKDIKDNGKRVLMLEGEKELLSHSPMKKNIETVADKNEPEFSGNIRREKSDNTIMCLLGISGRPVWSRLKMISNDTLYKEERFKEVSEPASKLPVRVNEFSREISAVDKENCYSENVPMNTGAALYSPDAVCHSSKPDCMIEQAKLLKPDSASFSVNADDKLLSHVQMQESLADSNQMSVQNYQDGSKRLEKEQEPNLGKELMQDSPADKARGTASYKTGSKAACGLIDSTAAKKVKGEGKKQPGLPQVSALSDIVAGNEEFVWQQSCIIPHGPAAALIKAALTNHEKKHPVSTQLPTKFDSEDFFSNCEIENDNLQSSYRSNDNRFRVFTTSSISSGRMVTEKDGYLFECDHEYPRGKYLHSRHYDYSRRQVSGKRKSCSGTILDQMQRVVHGSSSSDRNGLADLTYQKLVEKPSGQPLPVTQSSGSNDNSSVLHIENRPRRTIGVQRAGFPRRQRLSEFCERNYLSTINLGILRYGGK